MNKSQLLRSLARKAGLCDKWFSEWKDDETDDSLIQRYIDGIDFCILHDYPSIPVIRSTFSPETLRKHNIILDEHNAVIAHPQPTTVILGDSKAYITPSGYSVSDIYLRHNSVATIRATGHAIVAISVYDNATVNVTATKDAKVRIYKFSENVKIKSQEGMPVAMSK